MKILVRSITGALVVVASLLAENATGAERPLTLAEAITLALAKNERLLIEREDLGAATAAVSGARGAYDPRLLLDGTWATAKEPVNSEFSGAPAGELAAEVRSSEAGVALHQLLPTGGALTLYGRGARETTDGVLARLSPAYTTRIGATLRQPLLRRRSMDPERLAVRRSEAGRRFAAASLRRAVVETVAAAEQAYWGLSASRLAVHVREEAVRLAEDQLGETRTRVESGAAPETDLAEPRAELERRRGELFAARETLARSENDLKLLIFSDRDQEPWLARLVPVDSVTIDVAPVDVPASLERALDSRPELEEGLALVDRRRAESAFARDGVWPALDALASYDRFGLTGSANPAAPGEPLPPALGGGLGRSLDMLGDGDLHAARVGLALELPVLNRTARAEAAIARSGERQAEIALERVRKGIRAEVLDAAAGLITAGQRIEAARSGHAAAVIQLAAEREKFGIGLSTNFLVLTRQNDLSRARLDEISALTDYRAARTELARATGTLLEERGIEVEESKNRGGSR